MEKHILIKIEEEDREFIKKAAKITSVGYSTFCRMAAMKEARSVKERYPNLFSDELNRDVLRGDNGREQ